MLRSIYLLSFLLLQSLFAAPFCGSKQSFQKPPTYNPQDFPLLAVFQQIKHLKDNSSRQNHLVIVGFLG